MKESVSTSLDVPPFLNNGLIWVLHEKSEGGTDGKR